MAKYLKIADLKDVDELLNKHEISWGKAAEILENKLLERLQKCPHLNIAHITETPTDGESVQESSRFFQCVDCARQLPINSIISIERKIPLINDEE